MPEPLIEHDALLIKRQFITRSFFPIGHLATKAIGIVPSSDDVAEVEQQQAYQEILGAMHHWANILTARVSWYEESYRSMLTDNPEIPERELAEHLGAFGLSLLIDASKARRVPGV